MYDETARAGAHVQIANAKAGRNIFSPHRPTIAISPMIRRGGCTFMKAR
jgi:hypothetical protein